MIPQTTSFPGLLRSIPPPYGMPVGVTSGVSNADPLKIRFAVNAAGQRFGNGLKLQIRTVDETLVAEADPDDLKTALSKAEFGHENDCYLCPEVEVALVDATTTFSNGPYVLDCTLTREGVADIHRFKVGMMCAKSGFWHLLPLS